MLEHVFVEPPAVLKMDVLQILAPFAYDAQVLVAEITYYGHWYSLAVMMSRVSSLHLAMQTNSFSIEHLTNSITLRHL